MRLQGLTLALRQHGNLLTADTPERQLFEAWAYDRGRELRRSKTNPSRYAVEQVNQDFEVFNLGLMCGKQGLLELQTLVNSERPIGPC